MSDLLKTVTIGVVKIHYFQNVHDIKKDVKTIFCFHGNSSSYLTFEKFAICAEKLGIQVIAPDLPGCGRSDRLKEYEYSMKIVGSLMSEFIKYFNIKTNCLNLFGHSLGGHLLAYIDVPFAHIAIAGTPPLASANDFQFAFNPPDEETKKLLPLLAKVEPFTIDEATRFVSHTGMAGELLQRMIKDAMETDGNFRSGCLKTLVEKDQLVQLNRMDNSCVVVIHAIEDGVINFDWLDTKLNKNILFEGKIHLVKGKHMSPHLSAEEIAMLLHSAF